MLTATKAEGQAIKKKVQGWITRELAKPLGEGRQQYERKAFEYIKWLNNKNGVTLPTELKFSQVVWEYTPTNTKTKTGKRRYISLISAIEYGRYENIYRERKDGRQGAYCGRRFIAEYTIDIPNWDWMPEIIDNSEQMELV